MGFTAALAGEQNSITKPTAPTNKQEKKTRRSGAGLDASRRWRESYGTIVGIPRERRSDADR